MLGATARISPKLGSAGTNQHTKCLRIFTLAIRVKTKKVPGSPPAPCRSASRARSPRALQLPALVLEDLLPLVAHLLEDIVDLLVDLLRLRLECHGTGASPDQLLVAWLVGIEDQGARTMPWQSSPVASAPQKSDVDMI